MDNLKECHKIVELYDKQLEFAQNIQKKIIPLPGLFKSDYYHFYAKLRPFRKVGGDFYDFHVFDDDRVSLILADATGHGIDAAMITSMVKLIYSYAIKNPETADSPALLLKQMEHDIEQQLTSTFFSAFSILFDPCHQTIRFANAGHPSALLISDDLHLLKPTLPLIGLHGMMSRIEYTNMELPFKKGDKLILFTDGLIDAQNSANEAFGMENVLKVVEPLRDYPLSLLCDRIIAENERFKGSAQQGDDICLIGIEYDV